MTKGIMSLIEFDDDNEDDRNLDYGSKLALRLHKQLLLLGVDAQIHAASHAGPHGDEATVQLALTTDGIKRLTAALSAVTRGSSSGQSV